MNSIEKRRHEDAGPSRIISPSGSISSETAVGPSGPPSFHAFGRRTNTCDPSPTPSYTYEGSGTEEDPYLVDFDHPRDPQNPKDWPKWRKWLMTLQLAMGTFCVSICSSSYAGGIHFMMRDLNMSEDVAILGISLYVLGFALGPLIWAPMCELFGRRVVFFSTYTPFTLFQLGGALAQNKQSLILCRFFAGAFGSSPLTNAGGVISDVWDADERGIAMTMYAMATLFGPIVGPIVGGFVSEAPALGWRWNFWIMLILSGANLTVAAVYFPETYAPIVLRWRARKLQDRNEDRIWFISKYRKGENLAFGSLLKTNLSRPFVFLFREPIVMALASYSAVIYSILYAFFESFPIVFVQGHGFSQGQNGLAFWGVGIGVLIGGAMTPLQNKLYKAHAKRHVSGTGQPEGRMMLACAAAVLLPVGMFWFAWATSPSIHWIVPIIAGIPFGAGMIVLFAAISAYLIDTYTLYAASALAANVLLRSVLAAAFPLFTPRLLRAVGTQWGCSVFAFLSLLCLPLPFVFLRHGPGIRGRSKFSIKLIHALEPRQPEKQ